MPKCGTQVENLEECPRGGAQCEELKLRDNQIPGDEAQGQSESK